MDAIPKRNTHTLEKKDDAMPPKERPNGRANATQVNTQVIIGSKDHDIAVVS
jgi:hypothetical protein